MKLLILFLSLLGCGSVEKSSQKFETPCKKFTVLNLSDKTSNSLCFVNPTSDYDLLVDLYTSGIISDMNYYVKRQNASIFIQRELRTIFVIYES